MEFFFGDLKNGNLGVAKCGVHGDLQSMMKLGLVMYLRVVTGSMFIFSTFFL